VGRPAQAIGTDHERWLLVLFVVVFVIGTSVAVIAMMLSPQPFGPAP
jgi:hypothetical protein